MKKLVSILCVVMLLIMSIFPASAANDGNEKTMTGMELSIKRISGKFAEKTEDEIAKDILRELGMSENLIEGVNEEYLDMVYNAKNISVNNQYGKVNNEGEVTLLSHEEAKEEMTERGIKNTGNSTRTLEGDTWDERPDSLFNKSIYVVETRNAPKGTMGLICGFEWIDESFYRCWDVVAISGTNLEFDEEATFMSVVYVEQIEDLFLSETTVTGVVNDFDFYDLEMENDVIYAGNFVGAKFDVPMDVYTPIMLWMYNNIGVVFMTSAVITHPQEETNFTVTSWYFHQSIMFDGDVSLSGDGLSLSISPSYKYDDPHQMQLSLKYIP